MESPTTRRRPCFIEEDDGLVSLAETEVGFSGNHNNNNQMNNNNINNKNLISRPLYYTVSPRRRNSLRNLSSFSSSSSSSSSSSFLLSPRSVFGSAKYYDGRFDEPQQHFLEACSLCKKRLADNCDIFMYRGDTPFCSEECRQQQIEMDEAKEKKWNISSIKAMRKKEQRKNSTSPEKTTEDYPFRPGTVAAA